MSELKYNILYIDDEPDNLRTFRAGFRWGYNIYTAQSAFEGFDILEENDIHLIISDQRMSGLSGTEFFKRVKKRFPDPIRIILTGYSEVEIIIKAINECGIYKYITKPWEEDEMKQTIENALEVYQLRKDKEDLLKKLEGANKKLSAENTYFQEEINKSYDFENIITESPEFKKILSIVERVATTNTSVLIRGESGTGKELLARAIHQLSKRSDAPLIKVNCAAIPRNLIESEFFGHEKGAFTGATQKRLGRFELANNGTLFLDEIAEMPIDLQPKLLRAIQEGEFERVGGTKTISTNVRIIAATNRNLEQAIKEEKFREDLFYRLNVFPIICPPLRSRKEDIPILANHFLKKYEANIGRSITVIPEKAMNKLLSYDYPGNIRELENIIERYMITSDGNKLDLDSWYPTLNSVPFIPEDTFLSLDEMEKQHIEQALKLSNGKIFGENGAALKLNINPKTLSWKIKKIGIDKSDV